jgi:hypothetical protein
MGKKVRTNKQINGTTKKEPLSSLALCQAAMFVVAKWTRSENPIELPEFSEKVKEQFKRAKSGDMPNYATSNQARHLFDKGYKVFRVIDEKTIKRCKKKEDIRLKKYKDKYIWEK